MARVESFRFHAGRRLGKDYKILSFLGAGWEGEVYLIRERGTGVDRTAKFFFPQRNRKNQAARFYAKKLHKLRGCPIVIQYHNSGQIDYKGTPVTYLVSEYVEGELLSEFLNRQPGKRLTPFQALHLLYALARGIEKIHQLREYHGDLHTDNIMVQRAGLSFDLKILDFYDWKAPKAENIQNDVIDLVRVLYDAVGGQKRYARQPPEIKEICCGLKRGLILSKFKTAGQLRGYLEALSWE